MAESGEKRGPQDQIGYLQRDVETLWRTLKFNRETIKLLDEDDDVSTRMRDSTRRCSDGTVCTPCSGNGCVMTVYH